MMSGKVENRSLFLHVCLPCNSPFLVPPLQCLGELTMAEGQD